MSFYSGKTLELIDIINKNEKSLLKIKLFFEEELELFWEIDHETAENIKSIVEFDNLHKYRLSLHTTFDKNINQFKSSLTRTYLEESNRISFTCSIEFHSNIESIKSIQSIVDLKNLPFIKFNEAITEASNLEIEPSILLKKQFHLNKAIPQFKQVGIVMICILIVMGAGFSFTFKNTTIENPTIAKAKVNSTELVSVTLDNKKTVTPLTISPKNDETMIQPKLPFVETNNSITYDVPIGNVALTFDDGPSKYTKEIIDTLRKYEVGGTFFFIGNNVKKYPDYVQYVHSNGYSIGSHSQTHVQLSSISYEKQQDEISLSSKAIADITNEDVILFRPPYGAFDEHTEKIMQEYKQKMIIWNNDPKDWKFRSADHIFKHIQESNSSGAIIILHENESTLKALPRIIEYLKQQELQIVSLK